MFVLWRVDQKRGRLEERRLEGGGHGEKEQDRGVGRDFVRLEVGIAESGVGKIEVGAEVLKRDVRVDVFRVAGVMTTCEGECAGQRCVCLAGCKLVGSVRKQRTRERDRKKKSRLTGYDEEGVLSVVFVQSCKGLDGQGNVLFLLESIDAQNDLLVRPEALLVASCVVFGRRHVYARVDDLEVSALEAWEDVFDDTAGKVAVDNNAIGAGCAPGLHRIERDAVASFDQAEQAAFVFLHKQLVWEMAVEQDANVAVEPAE